MNTLSTGVVVPNTAMLCLGGPVTYLAARAARRTGATGLAYLAAGFGVVTRRSGLLETLVPKRPCRSLPTRRP